MFARWHAVDGAVFDADRGDRLFSSTDAFEEVRHVAVDRHAARTDAPRVVGQRIVGQLFGRLAVHSAAIDENVAVLAGEHDPVAAFPVTLKQQRQTVRILHVYGKAVGSVEKLIGMLSGNSGSFSLGKTPVPSIDIGPESSWSMPQWAMSMW